MGAGAVETWPMMEGRGATTTTSAGMTPGKCLELARKIKEIEEVRKGRVYSHSHSRSLARV